MINDLIFLLCARGDLYFKTNPAKCLHRKWNPLVFFCSQSGAMPAAFSKYNVYYIMYTVRIKWQLIDLFRFRSSFNRS